MTIRQYLNGARFDFEPLTAEQRKKVDEVMAKAKTAAKSKPVHKSAKSHAKSESKLRPDGLREGSSGAKLVDFVCRAKGATDPPPLKWSDLNYVF